jgi:glycosyltransferase involved in cell wall biosynthesis
LIENWLVGVRVLFLNPGGQLGGAETSLLAILSSLRRAVPSWTLGVVAAGGGPLAAHAEALGVAAAVLPFPAALARFGEHGAGGGRIRVGVQLGRAAASTAAYLAQLQRLIRRFRPDVIHSNGLKMHVLAAWAARRPLVWHLHDYVGSRPLTANLLRRSAPRTLRIVANSKSVSDDARAAIGTHDVTVVYNAVDLARFSPQGEAADLDRLAGLPPAPSGTVRIGLPATFARWKGHDVFLRAIAKLPHRAPCRAYVIGDAVYQTDGSQYRRSELEQMAASLGLAGRIGFTGFVLRSDAALRALDIVVHASTEPEPFGLAIAEAMACGRAVIMSEAGGARELVTGGVDALVHTPGNADQLAARLTALSDDTDLRGRLGSAARRTAEQRFDLARLANELVPRYQSAAQQSGAENRWTDQSTGT